MRKKIDKSSVADTAPKKRAGTKERIRQDLERYGSEILHSPEMDMAFQQTHHTWSTVGEHTLRVALASLTICYMLQKLHIRTDIPAVVKSSLCHDLGILGRNEKFANKKECYRQHPIDSVKVARTLDSGLSVKTADIIERHMWPVAHSKRPNSLEGVIVSAADKYAAVEDIIQGSDVKHTGPKQFIRSLSKKK